jgi:hypothetical protein
MLRLYSIGVKSRRAISLGPAEAGLEDRSARGNTKACRDRINRIYRIVPAQTRHQKSKRRNQAHSISPRARFCRFSFLCPVLTHSACFTVCLIRMVVSLAQPVSHPPHPANAAALPASLRSALEREHRNGISRRWLSHCNWSEKLGRL